MINLNSDVILKIEFLFYWIISNNFLFFSSSVGYSLIIIYFVYSSLFEVCQYNERFFTFIFLNSLSFNEPYFSRSTKVSYHYLFAVIKFISSKVNPHPYFNAPRFYSNLTCTFTIFI